MFSLIFVAFLYHHHHHHQNTLCKQASNNHKLAVGSSYAVFICIVRRAKLKVILKLTLYLLRSVAVLFCGNAFIFPSHTYCI